MKSIAIAIALLFSLLPVRAADSAKPDLKAETEAIVAKVQTKINDGKRAEADFTSEIKEFDALLASHAQEKTDEMAQVLLMKAMLYIQIFDDTAKGAQLLSEIKATYPDTKVGSNVDQINSQAEAQKIQQALKVGSPFPNFEVQDLDGNTISIAAQKGKLVLVDFWATWCGPCVQELPNVLAVYDKYHDKGFDIIGISLDEDKAALTSFLKEKKVSWPQYFDGKGWSNTLAKKYGINSIPATFLLDQKGNILAKGLRGEELEKAVAKALGGS